MDIVTQGLLGAVAAQGAAGSRHLKLAAIAGCVAALLPDADVLIRSDTDPLLVLEYHRQFTHSLIFIPMGALIVSLVLWPAMRCSLTPRQLYGYAFLGYATAGLLDACTSYGTRLLWPFSDTAIAWSIIAIVDPLFSLILVAALVMVWRRRERRWAWLGLGLAISYLLLGAYQHQRALSVAENLATERNLTPQRILVKPTLGNLVLWRAIMVVDDQAYIDAVRVGLFSDDRVYVGTEVSVVDPEQWGELSPASLARRELRRFQGYADGLIAEHPDDKRFIGDLRYAMLPTSAAPLWGIVIDPERPDRPVEFTVRRELSAETRRQFLRMLWGD